MTTRRDAKLAFEKRVAECVGKHVGAIGIVAGDAPDAVLQLDQGHSVGLEIVSTVQNDWAQATRMTLDELRPAIEQELQRRGLSCFVEFAIEVPEHFPVDEDDPGPKIRRDRKTWRKTLPAKIAEVATQGPASLDRAALEDLGITGLVSLEVQPSSIVRALPGFRWSSAPPRTLAESLLAVKADKLPSYRKRNPQLAEFWLALGPFGAGTVEDGGFVMLLDRKYASPFDRVFLVDPGEPCHVWDVTPQPAVSCS